jgi:S-DNA-T family DNA segregation ATPase FtsK/SpoIIIE
MAKRKSNNRNTQSEPSFKPARGKSNWFLAVLCVVTSVLLFVAFTDYQPEQSPFVTTNPTDQNLVGLFGATVSWYGFYFLGGAAWLIPGFLGWFGYLMVRGVRRFVISRLIAMILCIIAGSALLTMQGDVFILERIYHGGPGGILGNLLVNEFLVNYLGKFGTALIFGATYLTGLLFILFRDVGGELASFAAFMKEWNAERAERRKEKLELLRAAKEAKERERAQLESARKSVPAPEPKKLSVTRRKEPETPVEEPTATSAAAKTAEPAAAAKAPEIKKPTFQPPKIVRPSDPESPVEAKPAEKKFGPKIITPETTKKAVLELPKSRGNYIFPTLDLLEEPAPAVTDTNEEEHTRTAEALQRTLKEFGVEVTLGEIHIGPVITRYEIYPAPGVRVEKITNLQKNIALGLRAQSVRILAPVPGKGCVGVEIPNKKATPVGIREILESDNWANAKAEIPLALGRDVGGKPVIADLARMPHLTRRAARCTSTER